MQNDQRGLQALGTIYLILSIIGAISFFALAVFSSLDGPTMFALGVMSLLQGFLVNGVLAWMSDLSRDAAAMREVLSKQLPDVQKALKAQAEALERIASSHAPMAGTPAYGPPATVGASGPSAESQPAVAPPSAKQYAGMKASVITDAQGAKRCGRCREGLPDSGRPPTCPGCGATFLS